MTPLEARRMSMKNHTYDKDRATSTGFRRSGSRVRFQELARVSMTEGKKVEDSIRRESSFHQKHLKNLEHIYGSTQ